MTLRSSYPGFRRIALAGVVALATSFSGTPAFSSQAVSSELLGTGPLRVRNQFLLGMGFLEHDPVSAEVLPRGVWQLDFAQTVANDFAHSQGVRELLDARDSREPITRDSLRKIDGGDGQEGLYFVDGEHLRSVLAIRRGLGRGLQLELTVPVLSYTGGGLDSIIENFHEAFELGQAGRLGVGRDAFHLYLRANGQEIFIDQPPGTSLGDVVVGLRANLLSTFQGRVRVTLDNVVKAPTGDETKLSGSGSWDFGSQAMVTATFERASVHAAVGATWLGEHKLLHIDPQLRMSGSLALEVAFGTKTSGLLQWNLSASPFEDLPLRNLSGRSSQITLGVKRAVGRNVLSLGLTENAENLNNSPDVGLHVGWTRKFGARRLASTRSVSP